MRVFCRSKSIFVHMPMCGALVFVLLACQMRLRAGDPSPRTVPDPDAVAHLIAAKNAERRGDTTMALAEWRAACRADTASPTLRLGLARTLKALGHDTEAVAQARAALRFDSTSAEAHRFLAAHYREKREYDRAAHHLEALFRLTGDAHVGWQLVHLYRSAHREADVRRTLYRMANDPRARPREMLQWTNIAARMGMKAIADTLYQLLLRRWPGFEEGIVAYGEFLDREEQSDRAEAVFRAGLEHLPSSRKIAQRLAWLLLGQERWGEADSLMGRVEVRTRHELLERKAWISLLLKREQPDLVVDDLERLIAQFPHDDELYILLGQAHVERGEFHQAAVAFAQAAAQDSSRHALFGLTYACIRAGRYLEGEHAARAALRRFPDDMRILFFLGVALRAQGKWNEAVEVYTRLVQNDSTDAEYLFDLASSLERAGRFDEAVAVFRRLLRLDPQNATALNYLGYMFAERGINLEEALQLISRALAQEPHNGAYLDSMGWVLYRLGRHAEAVRYLLEALQYERGSAVIFEHLGDVFHAMGQRERARYYWRQALQLDPHNAQVRGKLEQRSPE